MRLFAFVAVVAEVAALAAARPQAGYDASPAPSTADEPKATPEPTPTHDEPTPAPELPAPTVDEPAAAPELPATTVDEPAPAPEHPAADEPKHDSAATPSYDNPAPSAPSAGEPAPAAEAPKPTSDEPAPAHPDLPEAATPTSDEPAPELPALSIDESVPTPELPKPSVDGPAPTSDEPAPAPGLPDPKDLPPLPEAPKPTFDEPALAPELPDASDLPPLPETPSDEPAPELPALSIDEPVPAPELPKPTVDEPAPAPEAPAPTSDEPALGVGLPDPNDLPPLPEAPTTPTSDEPIGLPDPNAMPPLPAAPTPSSDEPAPGTGLPAARNRKESSNLQTLAELNAEIAKSSESLPVEPAISAGAKFEPVAADASSENIVAAEKASPEVPIVPAEEAVPALESIDKEPKSDEAPAPAAGEKNEEYAETAKPNVASSEEKAPKPEQHKPSSEEPKAEAESNEEKPKAEAESPEEKPAEKPVDATQQAIADLKAELNKSPEEEPTLPSLVDLFAPETAHEDAAPKEDTFASDHSGETAPKPESEGPKGYKSDNPIPAKTKVRASNTTRLVLFGTRHGNRNPEKFVNVPARRWGREGELELTNIGKQQAYGLGRALRAFVGHLVDPNFVPAEAKFFSSSANRAQMTLQSAVAGLYDPRFWATWEPRLFAHWSPVPYAIDDPLLRMYAVKGCVESDKAWEPISSDSLPELASLASANMALLEYIHQSEPARAASVSEAADVGDNIIQLDFYNATYPKWLAHPTLPGFDRAGLRAAILRFVEAHTIACAKHEPCRRLMGGVWAKHIIDSLEQAAEGKGPKLIGYASHTEVTLSLMKLIGVERDELTTSAGFVIELKVENGAFVRILSHEPLPIKYHVIYKGRLVKELADAADSEGWIPLAKFKEYVTPNTIDDWASACGIGACDAVKIKNK